MGEGGGGRPLARFPVVTGSSGEEGRGAVMRMAAATAMCSQIGGCRRVVRFCLRAQRPLRHFPMKAFHKFPWEPLGH